MTLQRILRFALVPLTAFILIASSTLTARADVGITIDGSAVNVYPAPITRDGRVFVPLRSVFENMGASVVYNNGQINATNAQTQITLTIGSTQATVNNSPVTIDVAPFIIGASTYVPLRFVSQSLGANVSWDQSNQVVSITTNSNDGEADSPPPPIPAYEPPPDPAPNYLWMPGYWAYGDAGYYWVPGTWVLAPEPGLLWTPGYWSYDAGNYGWHPGYWATSVGFYGGVNYGAGYYGNGFVGGMWQNNAFRYNTAVLPVNRTVIKNVYVNKAVVENHPTANRASYNGGHGGITARATASENTIAHARHVPMTAAQTQHAKVASQDRALLAKVNAGKPPVLAAPHPFTPQAKPPGFAPVTMQDHIAHPATSRPAAPAHPEAKRTAPAHPEAKRTAPAHPEAKRTAPPHPEAKRTAPPHPEAKRTEPPHPEAKRTAPPHPEAKRTAPPHPEAKRTAPPHPEAKHAEPVHAEAKHAEPAHKPAEPKPTPKETPHAAFR